MCCVHVSQPNKSMSRSLKSDSLHQLNDVDIQTLTEVIKDVIERLQLDIKSMKLDELEDAVSDDLEIPIQNFPLSRRIKTVLFELRKQHGVKLVLSPSESSSMMPQIFPAEQKAENQDDVISLPQSLLTPPETAPAPIANVELSPTYRRPKDDPAPSRGHIPSMEARALISAHRLPCTHPAFYDDVRGLFVKEMHLLSGYTEDRLREEWANTQCNAMLEDSDYDIDQCPCIKRLSVFLRIYHDFYEHIGAEVFLQPQVPCFISAIDIDYPFGPYQARRSLVSICTNGKLRTFHIYL